MATTCTDTPTATLSSPTVVNVIETSNVLSTIITYDPLQVYTTVIPQFSISCGVITSNLIVFPTCVTLTVDSAVVETGATITTTETIPVQTIVPSTSFILSTLYAPCAETTTSTTTTTTTTSTTTTSLSTSTSSSTTSSRVSSASSGAQSNRPVSTGGGSNVGAIVGGVIGAIAFLIILAALLTWYRAKRRNRYVPQIAKSGSGNMFDAGADMDYGGYDSPPMRQNSYGMPASQGYSSSHDHHFESTAAAAGAGLAGVGARRQDRSPPASPGRDYGSSPSRDYGSSPGRDYGSNIPTKKPSVSRKPVPPVRESMFTNQNSYARNAGVDEYGRMISPRPQPRQPMPASPSGSRHESVASVPRLGPIAGMGSDYSGTNYGSTSTRNSLHVVNRGWESPYAEDAYANQSFDRGTGYDDLMAGLDTPKQKASVKRMPTLAGRSDAGETDFADRSF